MINSFLVSIVTVLITLLFSGALIGFIYLIYQKNIQLKQHVIFVFTTTLLIYGITLGDPYFGKDENVFIEFILVKPEIKNLSKYIKISIISKTIMNQSKHVPNKTPVPN